MWVLAGVVFGALLDSPSAQACSCRPAEIAERLARASSVFVGRVISLESTTRASADHLGDERLVFVAFQIRASWKGPIAHGAREGEGDTLHRVATSADSGVCGATFHPDVTYLVFAGNAADGTEYTSLCSGNEPLTEAAAIELGSLGPPAWGEVDRAATQAETLTALQQRIRSEDAATRLDAVFACRALGPAAAVLGDDLIAALDDPDARVRDQVRWAVGDLPDVATRALPIAFRQLDRLPLDQNDEPWPLLHAIEGARSAAIPGLVDRWQQGTPGRRTWMVLALSELGEEARREHRWLTSASGGRETSTPTLAELRALFRGSDEAARVTALLDLPKFDEASIPALLEALELSDNLARSVAAAAFRELALDWNTSDADRLEIEDATRQRIVRALEPLAESSDAFLAERAADAIRIFGLPRPPIYRFGGGIGG